MDRLETDELAQLVAARLECLSQLRTLGARQLELVAVGDLTALLRVLAGKQRLLMRLQSLEAELAPFRDQPPEGRVWRTPADRQRCARMAELCTTLLAEILEQERQSEQQLQIRRDEASAQLQGMHRAGQAFDAYGAAQQTPARLHPGA
jgi:hypothetical protein